MNTNVQGYPFSKIVQDFHTQNERFSARIFISLDIFFNKVSNGDKILKINQWPV